MLTLVVAIVLSALGAEAALRLLGYSGMHPKPWAFFVADPLLGWTHAPGARGVFSGPRPWPLEYETEVEIDSLGLRGPERDLNAPEALRVLAVGDSVTAAFEVAHEESFVGRLEAILSRRLGTEVLVLNGGVRGYGLDQTLLRYRERLRHLQPDVVLLTIAWNDVRDNLTVHRMGRPFSKAAFALWDDGSLELVGSPIPEYPICSSYRLGPAFEIEEVSGLQGRLWCLLETLALDRSALFSVMTRTIQGVLARPADVEDEENAAIHPTQNHSHPLMDRLIDELGQTVQREGSVLVVAGRSIDLAPVDLRPLREMQVQIVPLDAIYEGDPWAVRFERDPHWNALGHERAADILSPSIERALRSRSRDRGGAERSGSPARLRSP